MPLICSRLPGPAPASVVLLAAAAAACAVPSALSAQDPLPQPPRSREIRTVLERLSADLVSPIARAATVTTATAVWECARTVCSAERLTTAHGWLDLCRQLRARVGPLAAFRRGKSTLTPTELRSCNDHGLDRRPGDTVFADAPAGRRPPAVGTSARLPAYGRPELRIVDTKSLTDGPIPVAGSVPVEVVVENTSGGAATVALQVIDPSRGTARLSYTEPKTITAGRTVAWRIELTATGSEPTGRALCGETTARYIAIVESAEREALPGYRPGNAAGGGWALFHDRNDADNERTVRIRFDCTVIVSSRRCRRPQRTESGKLHARGWSPAARSRQPPADAPAVIS